MPSYTRGTTIFFSASCLDRDGAPVTPSGATLNISYVKLSDGIRTRETITMNVATNVVSAEWDSAIAQVCEVYWSIKATGSDNIVQDGALSLTANDANG